MHPFIDLETLDNNKDNNSGTIGYGTYDGNALILVIPIKLYRLNH
jgi:hypothetical protein